MQQNYYSGCLDEETGIVTYLALPCPLPPEWRARIMRAAGNQAKLAEVDQQARDAIGVLVSRLAYWKEIDNAT